MVYSYWFALHRAWVEINYLAKVSQDEAEILTVASIAEA
jgi:hypothetical protein